MASGGWYRPPNRRKIREQKRQMQSKWFNDLLKYHLHPFGQLYQLRGPVTWPLLEGWYTRNQWFSRFFENISASLWYLFVKSFLVARSCNKNQKFHYWWSSYSGKEAQSPYFGRFWTILGILRSVCFGTLAKGTDSFTKNQINICTLTCDFSWHQVRSQ